LICNTFFIATPVASSSRWRWWEIVGMGIGIGMEMWMLTGTKHIRGLFCFISVLFWVVALGRGVVHCAPLFFRTKHLALGYNYVVNTSSSPSSSSSWPPQSSVPFGFGLSLHRGAESVLDYNLIWFAPNWELVWIRKYFDPSH